MGLACFLLSRSALADTPLSFAKGIQAISGPFEEIGKTLSREVQGRLGPGGKAQQYLDDYMAKGDRDAPLQIYRLARDGDAKAQVVLGYMLDTGIAVQQNSTKAASYFAMASAGEDLARYNLGVLTLYGRGIPASIDGAMRQFMKVKRVPYAFVLMTEHAIRLGQGEVALALAESAYKLGDPYGTYLYARLLVEKGDAKKAAKTMEKAAQSNVPQALDSMVYMNEHGVGMPVNYGMAAGWWIVAEVLVRSATLDGAMERAQSFELSKQDYDNARQFAAKWLINRKPYQQIDYTRTISYAALSRRHA